MIRSNVRVRCDSNGRICVYIRSGTQWVLVDTGACVTVCSWQFVRKFALFVLPTSEEEALYSACGRELPVDGSVEVPVVFPWGEAVTLRAFILQNVVEDFIVGRDVVEERGWAISVGGCNGGRRSCEACVVCAGGGKRVGRWEAYERHSAPEGGRRVMEFV